MSGNGFCPWCGIDERRGSHVCPVADLVTPALMQGVSEEDERDDPKGARTGQPLTMLFVGATEAQKDMMLSPECVASSWKDVFAERDQLRAELEALKAIRK